MIDGVYESTGVQVGGSVARINGVARRHIGRSRLHRVVGAGVRRHDHRSWLLLPASSRAEQAAQTRPISRQRFAIIVLLHCAGNRARNHQNTRTITHATRPRTTYQKTAVRGAAVSPAKPMISRQPTT